ncbi:hypothetical protein [Hahella sp. HN01]|uniref:tetratricopeptide repeat protein n=1 Tax=Hahella sp. HN01 TaxID=2847262 RepID=UPI001C1ED22F|nr:hypothetical protein [Hahella sp. HN01]MBU6955217.1 hypothetical protein [Hahella sp. HN01]
MSDLMDNLDSEELFYLGLQASGKGDHEKAILFFKRSISLDCNAKNTYLLAAEYAEIGMYERAYETMQKAVDLDPQLWTAHFQAGLIKFSVGDTETAREAWSKLDALPESSPLRIFKNGIIKCLDGDLESGEASILQGLEANNSNPALNEDMKRLLELLKANHGEQSPQPTHKDESATADDSLNHLFLSAYKNKTKQ